jgi:hypothetical protein
MKGTIMADGNLDPRPELWRDHGYWEVLLQAAWRHSDDRGEPYWTLDGLRCLGARLVPAARGASRTQPGALRLQRGEIAPGEYEAMRARYLEPQLARLQAAFREAGECLAQEGMTQPAPAA